MTIIIIIIIMDYKNLQYNSENNQNVIVSNEVCFSLSPICMERKELGHSSACLWQENQRETTLY